MQVTPAIEVSLKISLSRGQKKKFLCNVTLFISPEASMLLDLFGRLCEGTSLF